MQRCLVVYSLNENIVAAFQISERLDKIRSPSYTQYKALNEQMLVCVNVFSDAFSDPWGTRKIIFDQTFIVGPTRLATFGISCCQYTIPT